MEYKKRIGQHKKEAHLGLLNKPTAENIFILTYYKNMILWGSEGLDGSQTDLL